MPRLSRDELVEVNVDILRRAGKPIPGRQMEKQAMKDFGDQWTRSLQINLDCMRTALRSVGVVSHDPENKVWGLQPYADKRLAQLEGVDVWLEHVRIRDPKRRAKT